MCLSCFIEEIQVKSKQYLGLRTLDYPMCDVALEFVFWHLFDDTIDRQLQRQAQTHSGS